MTPSETLDLPMQSNDANAKSFRDYFQKLLLVLWREGEGFSGKRPFGNSGWNHDLYAAAVKNGLVEGRLDENGYVDQCDYDAASDLITSMIKAL